MKTQSWLDINQESWNLMMNINILGMFFIMQEVISKSMKNHRGSIVNFSSATAIRVFIGAMAKLDFPTDAYDLIPMRRLSDPQNIANVVTFLASNKDVMIYKKDSAHSML